MSWPRIKLRELITLTGGHAFKSSDFEAIGIPLIRIGTANSGTFKTSEFVFLPQEYKFKYSKYLVNPGDLLITLTGTVGKGDYGNVCEATDGYDSYLLNQRVAKININSIDLSKRYLYLFLATPEVKKNLTSLSRGVRQANIKNEDILDLEIPLPPLDEQKRIAAILDKADAIRRKRQQAIQLADDFLRSVFLDMFGDPIFNPKGWEVCNIEALMREGIVNGLHASKGRLGTGVNLIDNKALYKGLVTDLTEYRKVTLSEKELLKYELSEDDILFNRVSVAPEGVGKSCLVIGLTKKTVFESNIMRIRVNNSFVSPLFLTYFLSLEGMRKVIKKKSTIANQASINQTALKSIPVYLPPLNKQKEFDKLYWNITDIKTKNIEGLSQHTQLFNSLSQKAFAGEL